MIYFIQAGEYGPVKIGFTDCGIKKRIDQMQSGNHRKLNIIGYMFGTVKKEKELHKKFDEYRLLGEWFFASPELLSFILQRYMPLRDMEKNELGDSTRVIFEVEEDLFDTLKSIAKSEKITFDSAVEQILQLGCESIIEKRYTSRQEDTDETENRKKNAP